MATKIVGVTGGIGSGKSTVCEIFSTLGIPVFTADQVAKDIVNTDPEVKEAIMESFGSELYTESGLDRPAMAAIVFSDKEKLKTLNQIVHPAVARNFERWVAAQTTPYVIKEAAILIESGGHEQCDAVVLVSAPEEMRVGRVTARDGVEEAAVRKRMANQMSESEKAKFATFIIVNDEEQALIPQVLDVHRQLQS